ncbi:hypothetical protein COZ39_03745 [Candidatus Roizmanbacteria bacterium CG_4_10_14_3_um_filter_33_21]|uniref:PIN domain-containing protein n=2 Tax=Candidatus Roizmaniibacteriota TaxID=1752723 RepID=A0A2H0C2I5_9BACT|nr:MAG: hypothetical protein COW96_04330 [Candidatus Roizmanbacteria bacterium CG22_combo_CG10-13_8_21_14_all_33_16]PIX71270.1 MAG: hypothetical protein COZ39_03745 [Candidatus Roizmanbacteria bacterium CG_4_10_14_3_um_filter_33_21]
MIMTRTLVFFDTSVLFSALYSSKGGSYVLIEHVKKGIIQGITSQTVIDELSTNIIKIDRVSQTNINNLIINNHFIVCNDIPYEDIHPWIGKVEEKDIHVLVGTLSTNCEYLVTLDKKHLHTPKIQSLCKEMRVVTPKELLAMIK